MLSTIGDRYRVQGQYTLALAYHEPALTLYRELGNRRAEGTTLSNLGLLYRYQGHYGTALETLQDAVAIHREVGNRAGEGAALGNMGLTHQASGHPALALAAYREAIQAREEVRSAARLEEFKAGLAAHAAALYERAVLLQLELSQPPEAFEMAERGRARAFLDQLGNTPLDISRGADPGFLEQEQRLRAEFSSLDSQLGEERAKPAAEQNTQQIGTLRDQLATQREAYARLLTQLRLTDPEAASLVSVAPLTLPKVQGLLADDTTLLSYFVTADRVFGFVVRADSFQVVELPVGERALHDRISRFRAFADPNDAAPILAELASWLVAPLADRLTGSVVAVVPHGSLHYLPFAALPYGRGYLGETFALYHLPSASILPFIQAKRKVPAESVLAVGQSRRTGLPSLRFAEVEAAAIASLYGSQPLLGTAATKRAFEQ
jgi:hypothetical protein